MRTFWLWGIIVLVLVSVAAPPSLSAARITAGEGIVNPADLKNIPFSPYVGGYQACTTDELAIPLSIKNTNTFSDNYILSTDKAFARLSAGQATLKPNQAGIVVVTLLPDRALEGNQTVQVTIIAAKEGVKRTLPLTIGFQNCFDARLTFLDEPKDVCACDPVAYTFAVEQRGDYQEEISLKGTLPEWLSLVPGETLVVEGKGTSPLRAEGNVPCDAEGPFSFEVSLHSQDSDFQDRMGKTGDILPLEKCYAIEISIRPLSITYAGVTVPVTIKNNGKRKETFSVALEGISWGLVSTGEIILEPSQQKKALLQFYPSPEEAPGEYPFTLSLKGEHVDVSRESAVTLKAGSRASQAISSFFRTSRYYIGALAVLAAAALFIRTIARSRKPWKRRAMGRGPPKEKTSVEKSAKEAGKENVQAKKNIIGKLILFLLILGIIAGAVLIGSNPALREEAWKKFIGFSPIVQVMIVSGVLAFLIILLLLVFRIFRKRNPKVESENKKKPGEIERGEPKGAILKVIGVVVAVGAAAGAVEYLRSNINLAPKEFLFSYYPFIASGAGLAILVLVILLTKDNR